MSMNVYISMVNNHNRQQEMLRAHLRKAQLQERLLVQPEPIKMNWNARIRCWLLTKWQYRRMSPNYAYRPAKTTIC